MAPTHPEKLEHIAYMMEKLKEDCNGPMKGFALMHRTATQDGALPAKVKELIALGIAITVRCNGCISFHVHDALQSGAKKEEVRETIGVAILMGGGPSLMYGIEAYEAVDQFLALSAEPEEVKATEVVEGVIAE